MDLSISNEDREIADGTARKCCSWTPDQNSLNKLVALGNSGINKPMNNRSGQESLLVSPAQANYQTMLTKQNRANA
ncbi:hypothetical protein Bca52824_091160 [Brassica carinata]|uniref:Uncharacterized protein n=1 Tax=Brassica carinata TaxID=52824 RepID=A0A8X7NV08_BRACI|nr:hypothetical protein Bca52824_091160 [Brassica carinata]